MKREPKVGDRILIFDDPIPKPGTIKYIGELNGEGDYDSLWSDWDCQRKFFSTGWRGGGTTQKFWSYCNYTQTPIFLLPEFIRIKDWKKEKEWEKERERERKAYNPLAYDNNGCRCAGTCRCKQ